MFPINDLRRSCFQETGETANSHRFLQPWSSIILPMCWTVLGVLLGSCTRSVVTPSNNKSVQQSGPISRRVLLWLRHRRTSTNMVMMARLSQKPQHIFPAGVVGNVSTGSPTEPAVASSCVSCSTRIVASGTMPKNLSRVGPCSFLHHCRCVSSTLHLEAVNSCTP